MDIQQLILLARNSGQRMTVHNDGDFSVVVHTYRCPTGWRNEYYVNGKPSSFKHAERALLQKYPQQ